MNSKIQQECDRRRTLAIISHPDAGKTTLTEKLLLYGGAKDLAGGVRDRKNARDTSSDWLELEKQRGISVSSTVLQFDYDGYRLESEYGAESRMEDAPWTRTRWVEGAEQDDPAFSGYLSGATLARDDQDRLCILFESQWNLDYFTGKHPKIQLRQTPPE